MNRVEKWNEVYTILFPDDNLDSIPSPCKYKTVNNQWGALWLILKRRL